MWSSLALLFLLAGPASMAARPPASGPASAPARVRREPEKKLPPESPLPRVEVSTKVAGSGPAVPPADPASTAAVDAALRDLEQSTGGDRLAPANRLSGLGARALGSLVARLGQAPPVAAEDVRRVLLAIGAAVPDAAGRFREASPDEKPRDIDWLTALAAGDAPADRAAAGAAMETVALIRAVAATHEPVAPEALIQFAWTPYGTIFRDECGRAIRAMGDAAVPGLLRVELERAHRRTRDADKRDLWERQARYAMYQLDRIDRASPFKALTQADDVERVALLQIYGETKDSDAVSAVLSLCDDDQPRVRAKARWAWEQYVEGHPADPPKRKLKMPGGKLSDKEEPLYLTYHELADQAIRDAIKNETGQTPAKRDRLQAMTDLLLSFYDQRRAAQWEGSYKEGLDLQARGDLAGMARKFDWILTHDPLFADRGGMADGYAALGASLAASKSFAEAAAAYDRAVDVAPDGQRAHEYGAQAFHELALAARAGGRPSYEIERDLRAALELDPNDQEARALLGSFGALRRSPWPWLAGGVALFLLAVVVAVRALRARA